MNLLDRPRRLRVNPVMRELVAETDISARHLITPHFVVEGKGVRHEIGAMPGVYHVSPDMLVEEVAGDLALGLKAHLLFGVPEHKDATGSGAVDPQGVVNVALRMLKEKFGSSIITITDVCLCAYTDHGHCGFVDGDVVLNDPSVEQLAKMALGHAQAGADIVSPSDMMDGRVGAIRDLLDENGFTNTSILAYSAKYASAYYGPFRDACSSAPRGDRKSYQMDPRNGREAVVETLLDLQEGADMVMVKPALAYLDIIRRVRERGALPGGLLQRQRRVLAGEERRQGRPGGRGGHRAREPAGHAPRRRDLIITYHGREALQKGWI